nr:auxin-responsive protein IAA28-like isoform X2 [Ipomoea batatas]
MELELRLAPPNNFVDKGFDLNDDNAFEENEVMVVKKRRVGEAFLKHHEVDSKTSSLVLSNGQPNDDDDHGNVREEGETVSWAHVSSWRQKFVNELQAGVRNGNINNRGRNSKFVKVKMVGVGIGRKVDLRLYNSYHELRNDLVNMFAKDNACDNGGEYGIFYQDKVGDWLLAGGVPWQTFMESVQRIEIVRNGWDLK